MDYFLTSERLGFRVWAERDLPLAIALWGDPDVTRLIDARGQLTDTQVRGRLTSERASQAEHGVQYWPIFLLEGGEHVGCCGLHPREAGDGVFELGVHLRPTHWRHGYGLEASRAVIDYAFTVLRVKELFAGHNPENAASRSLLGKLGFAYTHDETYAPTGLQHPSYVLRRKDVRA